MEFGFKGKKVDRWNLDIGFPEIEDIEKATNVNLLELGTEQFPTEDVFGKSSKAVAVIANMIYIVCKDQASDAGVSEKEFAKAELLVEFETASIQFFEALAFFFLSLGLRAQAVTLTESMKAIVEHRDEGLKTLDALERSGTLRNLAKEGIDALRAGSSSISLQQLQESMTTEPQER